MDLKALDEAVKSIYWLSEAFVLWWRAREIKRRMALVKEVASSSFLIPIPSQPSRTTHLQIKKLEELVDQPIERKETWCGEAVPSILAISSSREWRKMIQLWLNW